MLLHNATMLRPCSPRSVFVSVVVFCLGLAYSVQAGTEVLDDGSLYTSREPLVPSAVVRDDIWNVTCATEHYVPRVAGCHPSQCGRRVIDNFVSPEDVAVLRGIAAKGMKSASTAAGPTILDINSG